MKGGMEFPKLTHYPRVGNGFRRNSGLSRFFGKGKWCQPGEPASVPGDYSGSVVGAGPAKRHSASLSSRSMKDCS